MSLDVAASGKWLGGSGITAVIAYLIATVAAGGRHPVWPYFLFAAVAVIGFGLYLTGRRRDQAPDVLGSLRGQGRKMPSVVITFPEVEHSVPQALTARGSAAHIPDDMTLWLIVQAGHSFYPQTKIQLRPDGTWSELVHFGRVGGSVGHTYTLYVVGADPVANGRLEVYKQEAARQDTAPLSEAKGTYPKVTIYAAANVIRGPLASLPLVIKPAAIPGVDRRSVSRLGRSTALR